MVEVTQEKLLAGARNLKAKGYTPQQVDSWLQTHGSNLADMKKYASRQKFVEKMKLTPEQKAQNTEKAKQWREQVAPTTAGDKVAEFMVTNPYARQAGFALQGISNAGLNPAGYVARAAGMDTRPLEAQNAAERITELAGQYGYDAAAMATGLSGLAEAGVGGTGLTGNVIKALAEGGTPLAETSALGSAVLTGSVNPQSTFGRILTDTAGGVLAPVTAAKMTQLPRSLSAAGKAVKDAFTFTPESDAVKNLREIKKLQRNINTGSLDEAMAEAERTGRSVLEVGDDAVVQAAQMARQQTPEARQIITKNLQDILEAQKGRTRGVIDENLGTQGKTTVADVVDTAKKKAAPLYKDIENMEDLAKYETRDLPQQNFDRWFTGSKVVDENGQPLTYYHGTLNKFDAFNKDKIVRGNGFWFTDDMNYASSIRANEGKPTVLQTYLNAKNPIDVNKNRDYFIKLSKEYFGKSRDFSDVGDNFIIGEAMSDKGFPEFLQSKGYDAIKMGNGIEVFEPNQIKSVNNSGAWSESPSLTDAGWTPESQSELAKVIKNNDVFADAIKSVKRGYSSLKGLPDTDSRVVVEARKLLSEQTVGSDKTLAHQAKMALKEVDPILNKVTEGKLEQANKIYENAYKFEKAADMGRDVFNNRQSIDEFKQNLKKLSTGEKDALKIGVRDEMVNKLGAAYNENITNKKFLVDNVRQKLKALLGDKSGDAVIDEAEQTYKLVQNANKVLSGSQTSEKSGLRDRLQGLRRFVRNPIDTTVDAIAAPFDNYNNVRLANALTNPELTKVYNQMRLKQIIARQTQPQTINYMPYLLAMENYANQ